jgi:RNA polymerase sigma-70 factor (ECF subfamily)
MSADLSLAQLVDQFQGPLYRFAHRLTGSEADACDLVQETFYIWVRKGAQLKEPAKVKAWLFTTLHREFLQARRHANRFPEVEFTGDEAELPSANPDTFARLDGAAVATLLQELDEVFRGPLALFYLEDYSYEEIAGILGLPIGTVKSRLSRGIAQLRQRLERDFAAGERSNE